MDYMDIDEIEEVPDTPERLITARSNNGNSVGNHSSGSSSCRVIDKNYFSEQVRNELREKGKSFNCNRGRRLFVRPDNGRNPPGPTLGNSSSSINVLHMDDQRHDKGKSLCSGNVQRLTCQGGGSFVDLTEQNGRGVFGKASEHVSERRMFRGQGCSAIDVLNTSSKSVGINNSVKSGPRADRGIGIVGAQPITVNNSSLLDSTPPRANRHRRLVRNGCISPHNIAKFKQVAEKHESGSLSKDVSFAASSMPSDGPSSTVDFKDVIAEAIDSRRLKGITHHHLTILDEPDTRSRHLSHRSYAIFNETTDAIKDPEGWRITHNTTRKVDPTLVNRDQHISRDMDASGPAIGQRKKGVVLRDHRNGSMSSNINSHFEDLEIYSPQRVPALPDTMSRRAHNLGQLDRVQLTKRQREGAVLSNNQECDMSHFKDSDIMSRSIPREPSTSRSTKNKNHCGASSSVPVIAIDELSPENGNHGSPTDHNSNENSIVRALQLEEDEMFAKQLQEQLYNEELEAVFGIDEEHRSHAILFGGRPAFRPASSVLHQHPRSNASRNPLISRGVHAQASSSTRPSRMRGRFPGRARTISSVTAQRNSIFPQNMDVDMIMQILEAQEAINGMDLPANFPGFNGIELPNGLLQIGREFNEDDYEMLLGLDENNHRHGGATHAQINNLPQTTVQVENLQECAICLETPSVGETIRHLPCLHRFHKDCIDEWLRRKSSCPVCKSSVT
uniref:uncharacterized protein LOC122603970 isoform X2 n=1 Tax=Erigeron canadensis TaxID=72917 RepID=UPI001CB8FA8A|nr:uncharacterized protein LOC122603970 isoform X2 [Erigeron canadensis]